LYHFKITDWKNLKKAAKAQSFCVYLEGFAIQMANLILIVKRGGLFLWET